MADMPWRYWSRGDLKEGTRLVLAALWRHARSDEREAYLHGRGPAPFVWPTVETVTRVVGRDIRTVERDLKALREAGLITRTSTLVAGQRRQGFRLLASPADDIPDEAEPATPVSQVYFIQAGECGPVKVGFTSNLKERLDALQVGHPENLRLLGARQGGPAEEAELHRRLAAHRVRGEWFAPAPEVLSAVEES